MSPEIAFRIGAAITYQASRRVKYAPRVVIGKDTRLSGYIIETALASACAPSGGRVMLSRALTHARDRAPHHQHARRRGRGDQRLPQPVRRQRHQDLRRPTASSCPTRPKHEIEQLHRGRRSRQEPPTRPQDVGRAGAPRRCPRSLRGLREADLPPGPYPRRNTRSWSTAHGAAYRVAPTVFKELGAEVTAIGVRPDGYQHQPPVRRHPSRDCAPRSACAA